MAYSTHWEPNGIRWVYSGDLTDEDILNSNHALYRDPRFAHIGYQICDFTEVVRFPIASKTVYKIAKTDREMSQRNPNIKVAVISNDKVMEGLNRMYQLVGENSPWKSQLFTDEQSARAWIES